MRQRLGPSTTRAWIQESIYVIDGLNLNVDEHLTVLIYSIYSIVLLIDSIYSILPRVELYTLAASVNSHHVALACVKFWLSALASTNRRKCALASASLRLLAHACAN